jgi:hypothetical protein
MSSNIPPKPRETPKLAYYTLGEVEKQEIPGKFKMHVAEPGNAASIIERNRWDFENKDIKPKSTFIRTGGYNPGLYVGRVEGHKSDYTTNNTVASLSEAKLIKSKEYSQ